MVLIKIIKGKNARLIMKTTRTTDLLNELSTDDSNIHFKSYITSHADDMSCDNLQDYFNLYFKDHPELLTADVIKRSNLERLCLSDLKRQETTSRKIQAGSSGIMRRNEFERDPTCTYNLRKCRVVSQISTGCCPDRMYQSELYFCI